MGSPSTAKRFQGLFLSFLGHISMTAAVAMFVLIYVKNHLFSTTTRQVQAIQGDGSIIKAGYRPLQSDITTTVSALASTTRLIGTLWASDVVWRFLFLFTMKGGVSLKGAKQLFSMLPPPGPRAFKRTSAFMWFTFIQIALFSSNFYSPALTGSITWRPAFSYIDGSVPINGILRFGSNDKLDDYFTFSELVLQIAVAAAARANLIWGGNEAESILMKRVVDNTRFLPPNSNMWNITIPYFAVESFEWIENPSTTLTSNERNLAVNYNGYGPFFAGPGKVGFLPDTQWGPLKNITRPLPLQVSETRILVVRTSRRQTPDCFDEFGSMPPNVGRIFGRIGPNYDCMAFARVKYRASVAYCQPCRISSSTVVEQRSKDALQLAPDRLIPEALALASYVSTHLLFSGYAVPPNSSSLFQTTEKISLELMSRAFQSSWMALTDVLGTAPETTRVTIAVTSTQAIINEGRVYLWCLLNSSLWFVGFLFRIFDGLSTGTWLDTPSFAAVLLNTENLGQAQERKVADPLEQEIPLNTEYQGQVKEKKVLDPWEQGDLPDGMLNRTHPSGRFVLSS